MPVNSIEGITCNHCVRAVKDAVGEEGCTAGLLG